MTGSRERTGENEECRKNEKRGKGRKTDAGKEKGTRERTRGGRGGDGGWERDNGAMCVMIYK